MNTELAHSPENGIAPTQPPSVIEIIQAASMSRDVDVAKLRELVELHERMERRAAEVEFNAALARVQTEMPRVRKNGVIAFKGAAQPYAKLEDIDAAVRPLLSAEGFAVAYDSDWSDGKVVVSATLSHRMGHAVTKKISLALDDSGSKNRTQASGSTISYGRRYLLCMHLNIITVDEDNDGLGAVPDGPISARDVQDIERILKDTGSNLPAFLTYMGVEKIADIQARDLGKAMNALARKAGL